MRKACNYDKSPDPPLAWICSAVSSTDRPVEKPTNTLQPSRCWLAIRTSMDRLLAADQVPTEEEATKIAKNAQFECGCDVGDACYWSTYVLYLCIVPSSITKP
jgi:hypothetical protein